MFKYNGMEIESFVACIYPNILLILNSAKIVQFFPTWMFILIMFRMYKTSFSQVTSKPMEKKLKKKKKKKATHRIGHTVFLGFSGSLKAEIWYFFFPTEKAA